VVQPCMGDSQDLRRYGDARSLRRRPRPSHAYGPKRVLRGLLPLLAPRWLGYFKNAHFSLGSALEE
jgi:hypothetical protein